ncbi:hypothetical protein [Nocardioides humi]|nr:hypothetical protein [Nocardioides humi]
MDSEVYLVFARLQLVDPLAHLGTVRAPNVALARQYARTTYDEDSWIEMMVVPRSATIWVKKVEERA